MSEREVDFLLVQRVKQGEKLAFDILVQKYQYRVLAIIGRYVYDQHEIFDISQEVFIKVYSAIDNFRGDSAFYTWVYRIAANTAKNYLINKHRRPPSHDIDVCENEIAEGRHVLSQSETPENILIRDELGNALINVIDELPNELRLAIMLREIENLSYDEIASVMGCPVGTVRSRIFRAREAIDKEVKPFLGK